MANPFDKFKEVPQKYFIEALETEVTLRHLTVDEIAELTQRLMKGVDSKGNPIINYERMGEVKLSKVSMALVDPKMTAAELGQLSSEASKAIDEILEIIDPEPVETAEGK